MEPSSNGLLLEPVKGVWLASRMAYRGEKPACLLVCSSHPKGVLNFYTTLLWVVVVDKKNACTAFPLLPISCSVVCLHHVPCIVYVVLVSSLTPVLGCRICVE